MPNQHKPDREPFGLMVPRATMLRLRKHSRAQQTPMSEFVVAVITNAVQNIPLTSADYAAIAQATEEAERTQRRVATPLPDDAAGGAGATAEKGKKRKPRG